MSISPIYLLSGLGMIIVNLIFIIYWYLSKKIIFNLFLWGALAWIVSVALKALGSYFITNKLIVFSRLHLPRFLSEPIIWIYVGIMTGIFECGITLAFCFIKKIKETDFNGSVGFGIGFGGIESFIIGMISFISISLILLIPDRLPQEILDKISSSLYSPVLIPATIIERFSALFIHIFSCVLIILSVKRKRLGWFWLSFIYKSIVDGFAGYLIFTKGKESLSVVSQSYIVELYFFLLALVGIFGLIKIKKFFYKE